MDSPGGNQSKTVLVTGASGFIASHVIRILLEQGYKVRGTVRNLQDAKKVEPLYQLAPNARQNLQLVEADLMKPDDWKKTVTGCSYVVHVASPVPTAMPSDEQVLIKPAVEGTLNVLKAAASESGVERVVLTSSVASIAGQDVPDYDRVYNETDWTDLNSRVGAYQKSKTLAEQAAWKFLKDLPADSSRKLELTAINPSYVMGPICHGSTGASQELIGRLLRREMPAIPKVSLEMCDVRDVALAHVRAMELPEAAGQRFIINSGGMWFKDTAAILDREFGKQGYRVPSMMAPKFVVWMASFFDTTLQFVLPRWGKMLEFDNSKMQNVLKIKPINQERTIVDMGYSMIENGLVPKTTGYKPQTAAE